MQYQKSDKIKELIQDDVSTGAFGLVELELLAMEKEFTSQLSHNSDYAKCSHENLGEENYECVLCQDCEEAIIL